MKRGFSLIVLIAIVAIAAIGGGVYFSSKNNTEEVNTENTENNSSEQNAEMKGTFRSLMSLGKSYKCAIKTMMDGVSSEGVVYIDTDKRMRADFTATANGQMMNSSMIRSGDMMYSWSGAQGVKMVIKENAETQTAENPNQGVNLDQEVEYKCEDWNKDDGMFMPPSSVNFFEFGAGMPGVPRM